jgi:hypothetical protein
VHGAVIRDKHGCVVGVTDKVKYSWSRVQQPISAFHFVAAQMHERGPLQGAFDRLIMHCAKVRHAQANKKRRLAEARTSVTAAFRHAALSEQRLGVIVTVIGPNLCMTFQTPEQVQDVLGELSFASTYGAGTDFDLTPPFIIKYNPLSGTCSVSCRPEVVTLPSGNVLSGPVDIAPEGFVSLDSMY